MQLTAIEQTIVKHIHGLSFKEQQSLLDFILFLKGNIQHKENLQNHQITLIYQFCFYYLMMILLVNRKRQVYLQ